MKVSYYPGCSLDGTAIEYKESLRSVAKTLGIEMEELPDWTCCGASSAHATDDRLATSLAGRNLIIADKLGKDLMVPCSACFQRLKKAEKELMAGHTIESIQYKFTGKIKVQHAANLIWDKTGEKAISGKVIKPLKLLNPVCYYGCLTTRPPKVTDALNPEDPQEMDEIMKALGANVKNWSYKTDCCGGNLMLTHPDLAKKLVQKLYDMALEAGADCIVVGCPLCHSNLDTRQKEMSSQIGRKYNIPIYYFAELMALAFGIPIAEKCINKHLTDAKTLLKEKELL
jgi:heterodisulfide reductase subunit B